MTELQLEPLLQRICNEFPEVAWDDATLVTTGWDHAVVMLDDQMVFRFPLDDEYRAKVAMEAQFLDDLSTRVDVAIPTYRWRATDGSFVGYQAVPGTALENGYFATLATKTQRQIAHQLAGFLTVLHRTDPTEVPHATSFYVPGEQAEIREVLGTRCRGRLTADEYRFCERTLDRVDDMLTTAPTGTLLHGDVYGRHLFWDTSRNRLGVIDFSDACVGDPALDFAEIHEFGNTFVHEVYAHYRGPKDEGFLDRAWQYQQWQAVYMLTDFFLVGKTSWEEARSTLDWVMARNA